MATYSLYIFRLFSSNELLKLEYQGIPLYHYSQTVLLESACICQWGLNPLNWLWPTETNEMHVWNNWKTQYGDQRRNTIVKTFSWWARDEITICNTCRALYQLSATSGPYIRITDFTITLSQSALGTHLVCWLLLIPAAKQAFSAFLVKQRWSMNISIRIVVEWRKWQAYVTEINQY